jgi:hypothetical protein
VRIEPPGQKHVAVKEPLKLPPHRRTRWDDALETVEDARELVAGVRLLIGAIATAVFALFIFGIGVMYLVDGHAAGRVVGVAILAFAVFFVVGNVRGLRRWASRELEDKTWRRDPPPEI